MSDGATPADVGAVAETPDRAQPAARGGRAAMLVGGGIAVSRVVGLVRNTVFAHYFGSGAESDAFNAALKIPNIVRNLLGEGTISASFIPVYSAMLGRGEEKDARALAGAVLGILLATVSALTLAGIAFAPAITALVATGFDPVRYDLTTRLVRVLFPMTGLMVISGWCLGVQNSHRLFFNSYASAALWSIAQIALLLGWGARAANMAELAWWLAWATLAGSALQVLAQLPQVVRLVRPMRISLDPNTVGVRATLGNFVPVVVALGLFQFSSLIDLQIASWLPQGAATNLNYATVVYLLPISLFGISVAASSLPEFSRESGGIASTALLERLRAGWLRILFYIVPTTAVFFVHGDLVISAIYRTGRFGASDVHQVHLVLAAYAVGLVGYASVKLLASAFYALRDYRTPLRAAMLSIAVGTAISVSIAIPMRRSLAAAAGLALGAALGAYVNLAVLSRGLGRRLGMLYTPRMWRSTARIVGAAVAATVVSLPVRWALTGRHHLLEALPTLGVFALAFLLTAWAAGSGEAARWLRLPPRTER